MRLAKETPTCRSAGWLGKVEVPLVICNFANALHGTKCPRFPARRRARRLRLPETTHDDMTLQRLG